jgi:hypothetical protein
MQMEKLRAEVCGNGEQIASDLRKEEEQVAAVKSECKVKVKVMD